MRDANVTEISVPYPDTGERRLVISVGACRLKIRPSGDAALVTGTYRDPSRALPCRVVSEGGTVRITQDRNVAEFFGLLGGVPAFDLVLGGAGPYELTLESGAAEVDADFGGLPISRLMVKHGAGKTTINFSAPNPQIMSLLELSSGATAMDVRSLANANFTEMRVEGGAASYEFDFAGTLQRDAHVRISTGMAAVTIIVPSSTSAKISSESQLGSTDIGDGFTKKEGAFWTRAAMEGSGPVLTIRAGVALGSLRLRTA